MKAGYTILYTHRQLDSDRCTDPDEATERAQDKTATDAVSFRSRTFHILKCVTRFKFFARNFRASTGHKTSAERHFIVTKLLLISMQSKPTATRMRTCVFRSGHGNAPPPSGKRALAHQSRGKGQQVPSRIRRSKQALLFHTLPKQQNQENALSPSSLLCVGL
jgi:hypothetical protein